VHHEYGNGTCQLYAVVTVGNAVKAVISDILKAQQLSCALSVKGICSACQCAGAEGHSVHSLLSISQSAKVTGEHLRICHNVVCKGNGLRSLEVGISGHYGVIMLLSGGDKGLDKLIGEL